MMLNELQHISKWWRFPGCNIKLSQGFSNLVREFTCVLFLEIHFILSEKRQVVIILICLPVPRHKEFIIALCQIHLHIQVSWCQKSYIHSLCQSIWILLLNYQSDWLILRRILREKSFVPLTHGQKSMTLASHFETECWVKSCFVLWLNRWWTVSIVCLSNYDVWNELLRFDGKMTGMMGMGFMPPPKRRSSMSF